MNIPVLDPGALLSSTLVDASAVPVSRKVKPVVKPSSPAAGLAAMKTAQLAALLALSATGTQATQSTTRDKIPNMNGAYRATTCVDGVCKDTTFPTNYMEYPGGVESFDAYHGPITSTYSEVWWASWSNDLPDAIVQRFDGKVMAIVGVEMDQVMKTPNGDVSVPINFAYNHVRTPHHCSSPHHAQYDF